MYRREKPLLLKGSTSALANNLSAHVNLDKGVISYAVVHKSVVNVVVASVDGSTVTHRQIACKEPSATAHSAAMILQAQLVPMASRVILVITSQRGIQMFEADGSLMLYWYAIGDVDQTDGPACFGRGICGVEDNTICVGTHEGHILHFNIPTRGTNITLSEVLKAHTSAICDLSSDRDKVVSSDDLGHIIVWQAGDEFQQLQKFSGGGVACSSVGIWNDLVVAGYGSGHIRVFNCKTKRMAAEVTAHARWITAIDVAKSGKVVSVAEDSIARVWQLQEGSTAEIQHCFSEAVTDVQLQGVKFIHPDGRAFGVTGYDNSEIAFFSQG